MIKLLLLTILCGAGSLFAQATVGGVVGAPQLPKCTTNGHIPIWNNTTKKYACGAQSGGGGGGASVTVGTDASKAGTCTDGDLFYANDLASSQALYVCLSNTWKHTSATSGPGGTIDLSTVGEPNTFDTSSNIPTKGNAETITGLYTFSQVPVLPAGTFKRACEIHIWGTGTAGVLLDADDEAVSCRNVFGVTETITAVSCYANAGSPTVTPITTGGGGTSILSGALTCGTASWAAGTLNGTPTLTSGSTIDANITSAGGTATNLRLVITLTRGN